VIESVTVERLDAIAAEHDLVIVAGGRADLCRIFERDAERSVYSTPQRHLSMVMATGARMGFHDVPFLPVKFHILEPYGEAFWVPYFHKDVGPSWCLVFEAKPGTALDRFMGAKDGREVLRITKQAIQEFTPWDWEWAKGMELSDEHGWLVGRFAPTVRKPVGRLPSGRVVTPIGDTAMSLDPIGGQGANNGTKMARNLVECVAAHGDRPFDEAFLTATFESFYRRHGGPTYTFNNVLLEPLTDAGKELLIAQYGCDGTGDSARQRIADAFVANFNDPQQHTPLFQDTARVRAFIEKCTGRSWIRSAALGRLAIARAQLRQLLGRDPGHPRASPHDS
jgi:2-polyprenyl-6-methoxyphenol hydroxylase-like FAD-dependent oxidoreductase